MGLTKVSYAMITGARYNVLDYGATGDGATDDAAAIQSLIDAAPAGSCIYFPKGTYIIGTPLDVEIKAGNISGLTFLGDNIGTVIRAGANMSSIFHVTGAETYFYDLRLKGNPYTVTYGIHYDIGDFADYAGTIQNCGIYNFTNGIYATGQNYGITENWFQDNTRHIHFYNDGRNSFIDNNTMLGGTTGIKFAKTDQQVEGTRITNNTILCTGTSGSGITISDGLEIYIGFNIVDQSGSGTNGLVLGNPSGTVSSIKVEANWLYAGAAAYCFFAANNNTFLEILNNTFVGTSCTGLSLSGSNQCNIFYNRFLMTTPVAEYSTLSVTNINYAYNYQSSGSQMTNTFNSFSTFESLGVGVNPNSSSAIFEVASTTKGVRFPNMTTTQKNAIGSPVAGLVVYDSTLNKLCVYNGSAWQTITSA